MARLPEPLRAQLAQLEALVKADRAERRVAEAPVRHARRPLRKSLDSALKSVNRYNQVISDALFEKGSQFFFNSYRLEEAERALTVATATFKSRLADLMAYDLANNIECADYPPLPVLDREATIAAGKADHHRRMAEVRMLMKRDGHLRSLYEPSPTSPLWAPIEPPETNTHGNG